MLNYFLADDTIEVLEVRRVNSGRGDFPALLKRSKLPRDESVVQARLGTDHAERAMPDRRGPTGVGRPGHTTR